VSFLAKLTDCSKHACSASSCHNFKHAVKSGFENYFDFQGRASRSEFWYWILFYVLARLGAAALDLFVIGVNPNDLVSGPLESLVSIVLIIPLVSLAVRRLHDVDHSGWWALTLVMILVWGVKKGDVAINRFGPPSV
jgi:uncharacterized membrane protein YhaH (DUF805 family)